MPEYISHVLFVKHLCHSMKENLIIWIFWRENFPCLDSSGWVKTRSTIFSRLLCVCLLCHTYFWCNQLEYMTAGHVTKVSQYIYIRVSMKQVSLNLQCTAYQPQLLHGYVYIRPTFCLSIWTNSFTTVLISTSVREANFEPQLAHGVMFRCWHYVMIIFFHLS